MAQLPATYGEVLLPLDVTKLPDDLATLYRDNPTFRAWVHLHDRVTRAEKVSCWAQWTPEQTAAYQRSDLREFSRLRGYTPEEIAEWAQCSSMLNQLIVEIGFDEMWSIEFALEQLVTTPEHEAVQASLRALSDAASQN